MRPILVGMNNPISSDPEHALYPLPEGCTGNRIWKMLCDAYGERVPLPRYVGAFDRVNLCPTVDWNPRLARLAVPALAERLRMPGQESIIFGHEVWGLLRLGARPEPGAPLDLGQKATAYFFFHPSGRSLWYNDQENRRLLGSLLAEMYREVLGAESAGV